MKRLLTIFFILFSFSCFGQDDTSRYQDYKTSYGIKVPRIWPTLVSHLPIRDTIFRPGFIGAMTKRPQDTAAHNSSIYTWTGLRWEPIGLGVDGSDLFNGNRIITRDFATVTGVNLGTFTINSTLEELLYPSQPPTSTLTATYDGNTSATIQIEKMGAGADLAVTLNWTAGRQASTTDLSTVTVGGVVQTFANPPPSSTVSGTQAVTVVRNTNTTFNNVVVTVDGKTATSSATVNFFNQAYRGWIDDTTNIGISGTYDDAVIRALAVGAVTVKDFGTPTPYNPGPATNQYLLIAYPAVYGALTNITVNGIPAILAFNFVQRNLTNANGYTQLYNFYYNTQAQTASDYHVTAQ